MAVHESLQRLSKRKVAPQQLQHLLLEQGRKAGAFGVERGKAQGRPGGREQPAHRDIGQRGIEPRALRKIDGTPLDQRQRVVLADRLAVIEQRQRIGIDKGDMEMADRALFGGQRCRHRAIARDMRRISRHQPGDPRQQHRKFGGKAPLGKLALEPREGRIGAGGKERHTGRIMPLGALFEPHREIGQRRLVDASGPDIQAIQDQRFGRRRVMGEEKAETWRLVRVSTGAGKPRARSFFVAHRPWPLSLARFRPTANAARDP